MVSDVVVKTNILHLKFHFDGFECFSSTFSGCCNNTLQLQWHNVDQNDSHSNTVAISHNFSDILHKLTAVLTRIETIDERVNVNVCEKYLYIYVYRSILYCSEVHSVGRIIENRKIKIRQIKYRFSSTVRRYFTDPVLDCKRRVDRTLARVLRKKVWRQVRETRPSRVPHGVAVRSRKRNGSLGPFS